MESVSNSAFTEARSPTASRSGIGRSALRKEDRELLTGRARFVADLRRPDMCHAFVLRSFLGHARITSIDVSEASKVSGVVSILTADGLPSDLVIPLRMHRKPGLERFLQPPLGRDVVRYTGEPVAVVVAESRYIAEDAAALIAVEYDLLDPVLGVDDALNEEAPVLHPAASSNIAAEWCVEAGDIDAAFLSAHMVVEARIVCHRHAAVPLETRGLMAEVDPATGMLTLYGAAKVPHVNRNLLAEMLAVDSDSLRLVEVNVGGGFGARGEIYPEDVLISFLALRLERPILWVEDRAEHFLATNHSREQTHEIALALDAEGTFLGLRDNLLNDAGAYIRTQGVVVPAMTASLLPGPYRFGAFRCDVVHVMTNKTPAATFRAPGRFESNLARERIIDIAARRLGIDRIELRRRNLVQSAEMPYELGTEADDHAVVYDTGDYPGLLDKALARFDYDGICSWVAAGTVDRPRGVSVIPFVEKSGVAAREFAQVELMDDGAVRIATGATSFGQGLETSLAQICAEALGVSYDAIEVVHGDTAKVPDGVGTYGSRSVVLAGSGVYVAATRLRERILRVAEERLEIAAEDLTIVEGEVVALGAPGVRLSLREIATAADHMSEQESFVSNEPTFPYGVHCSAVEVDVEIGAIRVHRYLVAYDVGRAVNPALVEAQLVGGAVQGLGGAIFERLVYDDFGQLVTGSFVNYLLPTAPDVPSIEVLVTEDCPATSNPLGVKGAGEGGIAAVGAAIAGAVSDALGVQATRLPLTPEYVLELAAKRSV